MDWWPHLEQDAEQQPEEPPPNEAEDKRSVDNELYDFLHVSRTATDKDIMAAYRQLSRLYHPDKHLNEESKEKARTMFAKLQQAYSVLIDPAQRAIYDCLGKKGLEENSLPLVVRSKSPSEIRDEFRRLAQERKRQRLQEHLNPTTRIQISINATDLFDRYAYDQHFDDIIDTMDLFPSLEITDMSMANTIDLAVNTTHKVTLSSHLSSAKGKGSGSIGCAFRRTPSASSWQKVSVSVGSESRLASEAFVRLTRHTFATASASLVFRRLELQPLFYLSLGNQLAEKTVGYLTYSAVLNQNPDDALWEVEQSGLQTMIVHDTGGYHTMAAFHLSISNPAISLSVSRKLDKCTARGVIKLGLFGLMLEYGAEGKVTQNTSLCATMQVGIPVGVTLMIKMNRGPHTYTLPLHLCDDLLLQPIVYGTLAPVLGWLAIKKLLLDPLNSSRRAKELEKQLRENMDRLYEAKKDATCFTELMAERYMRILHTQIAKEGLVILLALYGRLVQDASPDDHQPQLLVDVGLDESSDLQWPSLALLLPTLVQRSSLFPNLKLDTHSQVIDVTLPVQCLVDEHSKLSFYEGGTKAELAGFYDPCIPVTMQSLIDSQDAADPDKHLFILYFFQGHLHKVLIMDSEAMNLPKTGHKILTQQPDA